MTPQNPYEQMPYPPSQPYQPPPMMPGGRQPPGPLGLQSNVAGLLAYAPCCIGLIMSIIFIVVEKSNRFVKFHAWQGLFFHLIVAVIGIVNSILGTVLGQISGVLSLLSTLLPGYFSGLSWCFDFPDGQGLRQRNDQAAASGRFG